MIERGGSLDSFLLSGQVVKGFGRGSKELGCPTANLSLEDCEEAVRGREAGVYYGWASVDAQQVHGMAMNIGWSPFYGNEQKTVEVHLFHQFAEDFYGSRIRVVVCGYIRGELNFEGVQQLIDAINGDIQYSKQQLQAPRCQQLKQQHSPFLLDQE